MTSIQLKDNCNKIDHCYLSQAQSLQVGVVWFLKEQGKIIFLKYCSEILEKVMHKVEKYLDLIQKEFHPIMPILSQRCPRKTYRIS